MKSADNVISKINADHTTQLFTLNGKDKQSYSW